MPLPKKLLPYRISEKATRDIQKAQTWYDEQQWGLGRIFVLWLEESLKKIRKAPHQYMHVNRQVQRAIFRKFPYVVFFSVIDNIVVVLRIRHARQKPLKRFR